MQRKMDNTEADIPANRPKAPGNEASSGCLHVSLIVRRILQHFSKKELLQLSLINKQWNYEARSLLRNRGTLMATIGSWSYSSCELLGAFMSHIIRMPIVPFSGVSLEICHANECQSRSKGSLDPFYKFVLQGLNWKRLSVKIVGCFKKCKDCPVLVLVKRILEKFSSVLEELSLNTDRQLELFQEYLQVRPFHRLKIFRLEQVISDNGISQNLIKAIARSAPNLQQVQVIGNGTSFNLRENLLEGSSAVLAIASRFNPLYDQVCDSIMGAIRIKRIEVCRWRDHFDAQVFNRFIPTLLQVSHTALTIMRMDLLFALPLMCYGICLENVTELEISVERECLENLQEPILALLKGFDFTRVFPKLTKVQIFNHSGIAFSPYQVRRFVDPANSVLRKTLPDRASKIKHLTSLAVGSVSDSNVPLLAQMFPALKTLFWETENPSEFSFGLLCKYFENLEELNLKIHRRDPYLIKNFDSDICGIFPEEVDELRGRDEEYLRNVNIVPIMPSITCLKGLKTLKLIFKETHYSRRATLMGEPFNNATCLFSRVTGLIALQRFPDLTVTIATDDELLGQALGHLKPYASIVLDYMNN